MADNLRQIRRVADTMPMMGPEEQFSFSEPPRESLVDILVDRFGGRWKLMLMIAVPLSLFLALVGWISGGESYQSSGAIRIEPEATPLIAAQPESIINQYEKYVETQRLLIMGRRNLENALSDSTLADIEWAKGEAALRDLEKNIKVEADAGSQLIYVRFEHKDPKTAELVADAVMNSYYDIYGRSDGDSINQKLERLTDIKTQQERALRSIHLDTQQIVNRYGSADLNALQMLKLQWIDEFENMIAAGQKELRRIETGEVRTAGPTLQVSQELLERLKALDPKLAQMHDIASRASTEFETIERKYRPGTAQYERSKDDAEIAGDLFKKQLQQAMIALEQSGNGAGPAFRDWHTMTAAQINEEIKELRADADQVRTEVQQLVADMKQMSDKELDRMRHQEELDRTLARINGLDLESDSIKGRITVAQDATKPLGVYADTRKKNAIFGFGFALFGTVGVFFVIGTVDRRAYAATQLRPSASGAMAPPCLGVLPVLDQEGTDEESREVASHCVHQIRNQIEALRDQSDGYVLAVSSPFQGDGKTSIVLALGWSYAAAGYRTILVDCDLVGRSLTRQLGLVGQSGLKETIASGTINGGVKTLTVHGLSAMPAGIDGRVGPETVRRRELQKLFDELKSQYEIVIVDTGPLLGSLESTPVSAAADGVLLTVRRGRSRTRLEECVTKLDAVGARCIGMVLNYAGRSDTYRYVSEASLADAEDRAHPERLPRPVSNERNALVLAMESTTRTKQDSEE